MPLERDEVAAMILSAFGVVGAESKGTRVSDYGASQISDLLHVLRGRPAAGTARVGTGRGSSMWIELLSNPEITRITIWDPALKDAGRPWNYATFDFPPNSPRFLNEFFRAQNHRLIIDVHFQRDDTTFIIDSVALWGSETFMTTPA
jgi:hypothetical protein